MQMPRGVRNNNPGNIRRTDTRWQGERLVVTDSAFEEFETPEDGIRALALILRNYQRKHGLKCVAQIIARWAPPCENDTGSYAGHVAGVLGVSMTAPIDTSHPGTLATLVRAIIRHENGVQPYSDEEIEEGVKRALEA